MDRLQTIMEKLESDPSLVTQEDYDEIEEISENLVRFLDEHPDIDRKSFMMGFTTANMNAIIEILRTTTEELQYGNDLLFREMPELEEVNYDDSELEEGENPWPLRSRES